MKQSDPAYMAQRLELGNKGDREALCRLYGEAAACLKSGSPMPQSLADWLAANLEEVSRAVYQFREGRDTSRQVQQKIAQAMKVQRKGVKGRLPSPVSARKEWAYAGDVAHLRAWDRFTLEEAIAEVASSHSISESEVSDACTRFSEEFKI